MAVAAVARPQTPQSATRFEPSDKIFVPKAEPADLPKNGDQNPVRPPSKPSKSLRLEPNPFEQSFSRTSVPTLADGRPIDGPDASPNLPALKSPRISHSPPGDPSKNLTTPKPVLPPVTAIDSPSTAFSWQASDLGSLRSGPLSPAMLAGPRERPTPGLPTPGGTGLTPFVAEGFRSGLTPDVNRTGLTPLVGGPVSFPPPSPNTAAFLAMVTNSNNAAAHGLQGPEATITPNTLNALTGVLNGLSTSSAPPVNSIPSNDSLNSNTAGQPLSHVAYMTDPSYAKYYPGPAEQARGALPPPPITSQHSQPPVNQQGGVNGQNGYAPAAATATAHAATGLYLLSQAHHELTRREEMERLAKEQAAQQAVQQQVQHEHPSHRARRQSTVSISTTDTVQSPVVGKRKSLDLAQQPQQNASGRSNANSRPSKRARTNGKAKRGMSMDEDELMGMDMDDFDEADMGTPSANGRTELVKKVETDEEKRRNFLERNRQAALKCRQRKKAWLQQLQQKTEYLTAENERLQASLAGAREEVQRLTAALVSHRDGNLNHGGAPLPAMAGVQRPHAHPNAQMMQGHPVQHHQGYGPVVNVQGVTPPQPQGVPPQHSQQQNGNQHPIPVSVPVQGGQSRGNGFGY